MAKYGKSGKSGGKMSGKMPQSKMGTHMMSGGHMMSDKEMAKMMKSGKKGK